MGLVAGRIVSRRLQLGLTQQELADRLGIHVTSVSQAEHRGLSRLDTLQRWAKSLECSTGWLVGVCPNAAPYCPGHAPVENEEGDMVPAADLGAPEGDETEGNDEL